jgi:hypothetical protein
MSIHRKFESAATPPSMIAVVCPKERKKKEPDPRIPKMSQPVLSIFFRGASSAFCRLFIQRTLLIKSKKAATTPRRIPAIMAHGYMPMSQSSP